MIERIRASELSKGSIAKKEECQRRFEIDAQLSAAITKGVSVDHVLSHPAGLMGKGACGHLFKADEEEIAYIKNRHSELLSNSGSPLFNEIAFRAEGIVSGFLREVSVEEQQARVIEGESGQIEAINQQRRTLGMNEIELKEFPILVVEKG